MMKNVAHNRVADIRNFIVDLDAKIEEALIDPEEIEQLKEIS